MNIGLLIITALYLVASVIFLYCYHKSEYKLKETFQMIKELAVELKKFMKKNCIFCVNKEIIQKELGAEKSVEINELMNETLAMNEGATCKEPIPGLSLDLCLSDPLNKEEIIIREKVLKILQKNEHTIFDGGKEKLVIPMESILFLTKRYNPLVSEDGDIIINVKRDKSSADDRINDLVIKLENGEILYEDDKTLMESILKFHDTVMLRENIKEKEVSNPVVLKEDISAIEEIKENEPKKAEMPIKAEMPKPKIENAEKPKSLNINKAPVMETFDGPDLPIHAPSVSPYDDIEDEEKDSFDDEELDLDTGLDDFLDSALAEIDEMELEENEIEESQKDFYQKLQYKSHKGSVLDFENITSSLEALFSKDEVHTCFFNNLAKTTPLALNANKTAIVADINNVFFAISKICGMESQNYIESFKNLKKEKFAVMKVLEKIFEIYLSDIVSNEKRATFYLVKEKRSENTFIANGFVFKVDSFLGGLSESELDHFRSSPYEEKYTLIKKSTKDESKKASPLIFDIKDAEIF